MTKVEKEFCKLVVKELENSSVYGLGNAFALVLKRERPAVHHGCPVQDIGLKKALGKCARSSCMQCECCIRAYGDYVAHQVAMHAEERMEAYNDNREDS